MSPSSSRLVATSPTLAPAPTRPKVASRGTAGSPAPAAGEPYVVATHKVRDRSTSVPQAWLPYGVQHAWVPGTRRTYCGQPMTGWTVFWERRFSAGHPSACSECVEAALPAASRSRLDPRRR